MPLGGQANIDYILELFVFQVHHMSASRCKQLRTCAQLVMGRCFDSRYFAIVNANATGRVGTGSVKLTRPDPDGSDPVTGMCVGLLA